MLGRRTQGAIVNQKKTATSQSLRTSIDWPDLLLWLIDGPLQQAIRNQEVIMAKLDDLSTTTGQKIDSFTAKSDKAFAEIRKALDDALNSQITQQELDDAVAAAKAAQKESSEAEFNQALDAAFAPLTEKLSTAEASLQKLDDIVPDAPTPEPAG